MVFREIAEEFKKYAPGFIIGSIADGGNELLVYLTKNDLGGESRMDDQEYRYDKKTKKITPFRRTDDPGFARKAEQHILYIRKGMLDT